MIISGTGYTGSGGFELYIPKEHGVAVWKRVFEAGAEFDIKPIGLGARDTLRLEKGYCLYGNDITDETSPLEAGLGWITKFTKEFTNSENLKKQKEEVRSHRYNALKTTQRPQQDASAIGAQKDRSSLDDGQSFLVVQHQHQARHVDRCSHDAQGILAVVPV